MDSYQDRRLIVRPFNKNMTDEELDQYLATRTNYNEVIPALIEANRRKDKQISDLSRRITTLEDKTLKKPGRKRQSFHWPGIRRQRTDRR